MVGCAFKVLTTPQRLQRRLPQDEPRAEQPCQSHAECAAGESGNPYPGIEIECQMEEACGEEVAEQGGGEGGDQSGQQTERGEFGEQAGDELRASCSQGAQDGIFADAFIEGGLMVA